MTTAVAGAPDGSRRVLVTICTMAATIMQALDTTIANVALPYRAMAVINIRTTKHHGRRFSVASSTSFLTGWC